MAAPLGKRRASRKWANLGGRAMRPSLRCGGEAISRTHACSSPEGCERTILVNGCERRRTCAAVASGGSGGAEERQRRTPPETIEHMRRYPIGMPGGRYQPIENYGII